MKGSRKWAEDVHSMWLGPFTEWDDLQPEQRESLVDWLHTPPARTFFLLFAAQVRKVALRSVDQVQIALRNGEEGNAGLISGEQSGWRRAFMWANGVKAGKPGKELTNG